MARTPRRTSQEPSKTAILSAGVPQAVAAQVKKASHEAGLSPSAYIRSAVERMLASGSADKQTKALLREVRALCRVPGGTSSSAAAALRAHRIVMEDRVRVYKGRVPALEWGRLLKQAQMLTRTSAAVSTKPASKDSPAPRKTWEERVDEAHAEQTRQQVRAAKRKPPKTKPEAAQPDADSTIASEPETEEPGDSTLAVQPEDAPPALTPEQTKRVAWIDGELTRLRDSLSQAVWRSERDKIEDRIADLSAERVRLVNPRREPDSVAWTRSDGSGVRNPDDAWTTRGEQQWAGDRA